ncbi:DUF5658 family protein [Salinarchaeum laminariae]|uniref:DUF5658 family protein n=1 Tax=Salinarchaeum laminariae TaxID=869888 RepID=UPI0020BEEB66|nr:DUF5658 family protein [Salinarchaeum laminariae]
MNRERSLWAALVALAAGDAATTLVALEMGLPEANPLLAALVGAVGLLAIPLSQVVYVGGAAAIVRVVEDHGRRPVLLAGISLSAIVVANNLAAVLVVGWSA